MKIMVIGAGPAGLSAIRNCLEQNIECIAFEQTGKIGGVWNYVDDSTVDEFGLPVHSSMYKGLTTNLPKELMEMDQFPHEDKGYSFISSEEVLEYIHQYAERFNLLPSVKFYHQVLLVDPLPDNRWTVNVKNLRTNEITVDTYDGVIVCNGHHFDPLYPAIPGMDYFKEKSIHSHYYRKPDEYRDRKVLVIGAGPSGSDISRIVAEVAHKVYLSFGKDKLFGKVPNGVIPKPRVTHFKNNVAVFEDKTQEDIDDIIYCTGYKYTFNFLSDKCQVSVDEDVMVMPLYKHLINIEHPSMAFTNIVTYGSPFPLFGLQIRFYLALLTGHVHISKEEMYENLKKDREAREEKGLSRKKAHYLLLDQVAYFEDLANTANIQRLPPVIGKLFDYYVKNKMPRMNFKLLNDEEFEIKHP